jgi:hypothetical protein
MTRYRLMEEEFETFTTNSFGWLKHLNMI